MKKRFRITFPIHLPPEKIDSFIAQIAAYGLLEPSNEERVVIVGVSRLSNVEGLKRQLTAWDNWGFLRWSEMPE